MSLSAQPLHSYSPSRRVWVTLSVMLATIMQALDTTIANVALPHMQGAMGATQEQISWVLTSYIVAAAIFMPLTGYLSNRFGRKRLFILSVIGFTIASMLCGAAQSLAQIVLFRLLQGVFGACLVPISQSVLLDTYPPEQHGSAMAIWGMGVMIGPILGPSLGGWLTEYYSWRWVFYINLPLGLLAWSGLTTFLQETKLKMGSHFDLMGFAFLSIAIGSLQLFLDRGQSLDWFNSNEIIIEGICFILCLYLFVAHILTGKNPFIDPAMFKDRNFSVGLAFIFIIGIILLATMALLPPYLQSLKGYPIIDIGLVLAPRGIGTMLAMMIVGKLSRTVDTRYQILGGLILTSYSLWLMTLFNTDITAYTITYTGVIQGFGLGFIFVPLSTLAFATLPVQYRNDGTPLFSLLRNIGSSIGISIVMTKLAQNIQANHAAFVDFITPYNLGLRLTSEAGVMNIKTTAGLAFLNAEVTRQAASLAYLQDFRFMMWLVLCALPLLLLLKPAAKNSPDENTGATPEFEL
ncbi:DHA2 family efflux MFS transporter permease subunit [uncultured Legionella sp.]|uniref:DHA2 family efflux MFS transporter permease subunit n=1 Tax=uncultured Legionella sp. TaxID=210934 RepID=UPI002627FC1A|nr:DHA2 family efflux MFS transporter permease subunit [uncultured Legionella sp.]